jgi:hypothetical protein
MDSPPEGNITYFIHVLKCVAQFPLWVHLTSTIHRHDSRDVQLSALAIIKKLIPTDHGATVVRDQQDT